MNKPIGVIDSGVGGLTVLSELQKKLPTESFIYLGDTARCPYGSRDKEDVVKFTWEMVQYLRQFDIKMLVVACNTITAIALDDMRKEFNIPIIGVIEPGARAANSVTKTNKVAIIGTANTIKSKAYINSLLKINHEMDTISLACPKFVPLIESGKINGDETKRVVQESLVSLKDDRTIDTLILGCTHYPIIQPTIEQYLGERVTVLSSAEETAKEVDKLLIENKLNSFNEKNAVPLIHLTGDLNIFYKLQEEYFRFEDFQLNQIKL